MNTHGVPMLGSEELDANALNLEDEILSDYIKLQEQVKESGNINLQDKNGWTLLHFAIYLDDKEQTEKLLNQGAYFLADIWDCTPLHTAADKQRVWAVEKLLPLFNENDLAATTANENNVLHFGAMDGNAELLKTLLKDQRLQKIKHNKNLYGQTPVDYAIENKHDELIHLLSDVPITDPSLLPGYGQPLKDINQEVLNSKLDQYLSLKGRDSKAIINKGGNCNGWGFLYLIYRSNGNQDEFHEIRTFIADMDVQNLEKAEEAFQKTALKDKYKNVDDFLDHIINDLAIFQYTAQAALDLKLSGWKQDSRVKQYNLLKDPIQGRTLNSVFSLQESKLDKKHLAQMLDMISAWPGLSIDIAGAGHEGSIYITSQGTFEYYDSNHKNTVAPFTSSEKLVEHFVKYWFKPNDGYVNDKILLDSFDGYLFSNALEKELSAIPKNASFIPAYIQLKQQVADSGDINLQDEDGYTLLHYTIMLDKLDETELLLEQNALSLSNKDGLTPLHIAIDAGAMWLVEELLPKNEEGFTATTRHGDNILHYLVQHAVLDTPMQRITLKRLLKDKRFENIREDKNVYGQTALEIAVENKLDAIIPLLSSTPIENPSALPNYGKPLKDLSQSRLDNKLHAYWSLKERENEFIKGGNGWAFLHQIYRANNNQHEFDEIRNFIADMDIKDIRKAEEDFQKTRLKVKYKNIEDLLEHTIKSLMMLNFNSDNTRDPEARIKEYGVFKDPHNEGVLKSLFSFSSDYIKEPQLEEKLDILSAWPGASIEISDDTRAISLYITPQSEFELFDPDHKNTIAVFTSSEKLAEHIMKFSFIPNNDGFVVLNIDAYKSYDKLEDIPEIEKPSRPYKVRNSSPHFFKPLHYAILENALEKVKTEIKNISDLATIWPSPFELAISMRNSECLQLLVDAAKKTNNNFTLLSNMTYQNLIRDLPLVQKLYDNHVLSKTDVDKNGDTLLMNMLCYGKNKEAIQKLINDKAYDLHHANIKGETVLMYAIIYAPEEELDMFLENKISEVNIQENTLGKTALMMAIERNHKKCVEKCLEWGADITLQNKAGKTAMDYAEDIGNPAIIALLKKAKEPDKRKSLIFSAAESAAPIELKDSPQAEESIQKKDGPKST